MVVCLRCQCSFDNSLFSMSDHPESMDTWRLDALILLQELRCDLSVRVPLVSGAVLCGSLQLWHVPTSLPVSSQVLSVVAIRWVEHYRFAK